MRKILLVDDAGTMLLLEQMALHGAGYQILTARDGEAGVRAALAHRPGLILLEAEPEASETCRQLRAHEATREIPILLLSPPEKAKSFERGFPSGSVGGIILKPIDDNELLSRVKSLLGD